VLEIAKRKRSFVGLSPDRLELKEANALRLNLKETFDWAVLLFNTFLNFTTLDEQDRVLSGIRRHLKPGGRFWLDIFQPNLKLLARHVSKNLDPGVFYVPELDRTVYRAVDVVRDPAQQTQLVTFRYTWYDAGGRARHERRSFSMTFLFPRELRLLLERNGFEIEKQWGDYDGSPLGPDSPRMITLCRVAGRSFRRGV
jgi:SAM-dependent methyltransferase